MSTRKSLVTFAMRTCAVVLASASVLVSFGCAGRFIPDAGGSAESHAVKGGVHGGQQPIAGAQVYLYATHTIGAGTTTSSLLPSPATTDSNGTFSLDPSSYACASPADQVFFVSARGDSGSGSINNAITLIDPFGNCGDLTPSTFVIINEATTVAAAYALAPLFGNANQNVYSNSSSFNTQELIINNVSLTDPTVVAQLFTAATSLVNPLTGAATAASGSHVQQTINALANAAAACVNSSDANAYACRQLFLYTSTTQAQTPTDIFLAILDVAETPDSVSGSLASLSPPNSPFQPTLSTDPQIWSIPAFYNDISLNWTPYARPAHGSNAEIQ